MTGPQKVPWTIFKRFKLPIILGWILFISIAIIFAGVLFWLNSEGHQVNSKESDPGMEVTQTKFVSIGDQSDQKTITEHNTIKRSFRIISKNSLKRVKIKKEV